MNARFLFSAAALLAGSYNTPDTLEIRNTREFAPVFKFRPDEYRNPFGTWYTGKNDPRPFGRCKFQRLVKRGYYSQTPDSRFLNSKARAKAEAANG